MSSTSPRRTIVASAPTRLDFGGGWTDVPPYPEERGGFVCNIAITRRATVRLEVPASAHRDHHGPGPGPPDRLVTAALHHAGLVNATASVSSDFPVGAGLGGSSAAGVALAAAIHFFQNRLATPTELAEWSRTVEVEQLGIAGGRQDHYAAAYGGALGLRFARQTEVRSIPLQPETISALEEQCLLLYTGESRLSSTTITAVLDAYRTRDARVVNALDCMAALAERMKQALATGRVDTLAQLVREHWQHQRSLHPAITTERIDAIENASQRAGALGMKALGASGGGCVMVFAPLDCVDAVATAVAPFAERLDWHVDTRGVTVSGDLA